MKRLSEADKSGKESIRCHLIQAIDFCLDFDRRPQWIRIARALHIAGDVAEILAGKDAVERHLRKVKKRKEREQFRELPPQEQEHETEAPIAELLIRSKP